jgi:hypothetical protein
LLPVPGRHQQRRWSTLVIADTQPIEQDTLPVAQKADVELETTA